MKIGPGVSGLWGVENRPLPLTRPMAYTTACTTVQAVIARYLTIHTDIRRFLQRQRTRYQNFRCTISWINAVQLLHCIAYNCLVSPPHTNHYRIVPNDYFCGRILCVSSPLKGENSRLVERQIPHIYRNRSFCEASMKICTGIDLPIGC